MVSDTVEEAKKKWRNREGTTQQTRNATQGVIFGGVAHTHTQTNTDTQTYTHRHQDRSLHLRGPPLPLHRPFDPRLRQMLPKEALAGAATRRPLAGRWEDDGCSRNAGPSNRPRW
jgi:hypothetical protein